MNLKFKRELDRWYPLIDHPVQIALDEAISNGTRFPVVPAGRRSGKTERFKRFLSRQAMNNPNEKYFAGAPTHAQAKKIFWDDLKLLTFSSKHSRRPSESELKIYMPNGSEVHVIGLDKPQRIEGVNWTGGGIDEIADIKAEAVNLNIMPALDTVNPLRPDYLAWCWFLGVPDGFNHYYEMKCLAEADTTGEYGLFEWFSSEILPPEVIAAAKRRMSGKQFRQEYEASFETATGRIYEEYTKANHTTRTIKPHEQLIWMHDQNYTPLSSAIGVREGRNVFLMDEIVLTSAVSKQSAVEFCNKYEKHENKHVIVYGDPAGRAGEKHGHASDYTDIEGVLRLNGWRFTRNVKPKHPAIKDRQNAVRAKIKSADGHISLFVNPVTAKWCDKGLSTVQLQEGSTFQEDQKNQYQHITTAIGYMIDFEYPTTTPMQRVVIHGA